MTAKSIVEEIHRITRENEVTDVYIDVYRGLVFQTSNKEIVLDVNEEKVFLR